MIDKKNILFYMLELYQTLQLRHYHGPPVARNNNLMNPVNNKNIKDEHRKKKYLKEWKLYYLAEIPLKQALFQQTAHAIEVQQVRHYLQFTRDM